MQPAVRRAASPAGGACRLWVALQLAGPPGSGPACPPAPCPCSTLPCPHATLLAAILLKRESETEEEYRVRLDGKRGEVNRRLLVLVHAAFQVRCCSARGCSYACYAFCCARLPAAAPRGWARGACGLTLRRGVRAGGAGRGAPGAAALAPADGGRAGHRGLADELLHALPSDAGAAQAGGQDLLASEQAGSGPRPAPPRRSSVGSWQGGQRPAFCNNI